MKINKAGLDLIKRFEGLRLNTYDDAANIKTIGYGHTNNVTEGMTITEQEAEVLFLEDIDYFEAKVSELVDVSLTSNQFSALISFTFNLGEGALGMSTLLKKLKAEDYKGAADEFIRWNKIGEIVEPGLTRRRQAERELFLTEDEEIQPTSLKKYRERFEAVMKSHYDLVEQLIAEIEKLENS